MLAQGTLGERTKSMMGFRRSTIDLVLPSIIPAGADLSLTTVPSYYDGQLRIDAGELAVVLRDASGGVAWHVWQIHAE